MTYGAEMLVPRKNATCLISQDHKDHFDVALLSKIGCKVLGPDEVLEKIPFDARWKWENNEARIGELGIQASPLHV